MGLKVCFSLLSTVNVPCIFSKFLPGSPKISQCLCFISYSIKKNICITSLFSYIKGDTSQLTLGAWKANICKICKVFGASILISSQHHCFRLWLGASSLHFLWARVFTEKQMGKIHTSDWHHSQLPASIPCWQAVFSRTWTHYFEIILLFLMAFFLCFRLSLQFSFWCGFLALKGFYILPLTLFSLKYVVLSHRSN